MTTPNIPRRAAWRLTCAVATALSLAACDRGSPIPGAEGTPEAAARAGGEAATRELSPAARIALDSGNTAFKAKDFRTALRFYREAAAATPNHAAPWFGINMVGRATHNQPLADSAMVQVRKWSNTTNPHIMPDTMFERVHKDVKKPPTGT
jgi:hypothetical protein